MGKKFVPKSKIELRKLILNEDIELADIDTSRITDMSHLFEPTMRGGDQARFFYDGIEKWDVSHVTDMSFMFCYASNFNRDISQWNVASVTNMRGMFQFASSFNQNIGSWDVSHVTNMASMFYDASAFNQNLDNWDISAVKTMRFMFMYARYFEKKPLWDLSHVEDTVGMFYGSPIVYVDPNTVVNVDPLLEEQSLNERLKKEYDSVLDNDVLARFAKNVNQKTSGLIRKIDNTENVAEKPRNLSEVTSMSSLRGSKENEKKENEKKERGHSVNDREEQHDNGSQEDILKSLERLQKLRDSGLITVQELQILKDQIFQRIISR